jgi:hypothetical protein
MEGKITIEVSARGRNLFWFGFAWHISCNYFVMKVGCQLLVESCVLMELLFSILHILLLFMDSEGARLMVILLCST